MSRRRVVDRPDNMPDNPYLRVVPQVVWVGSDFLISSNTSWIII